MVLECLDTLRNPDFSQSPKIAFRGKAVEIQKEMLANLQVGISFRNRNRPQILNTKGTSAQLLKFSRKAN
jgi:hypothetical protein